MGAYEEDLAYVHDVGFGRFARGSAPGLLRLLRDGGVREGKVCDLGCGSGIWARALTDAGYEVDGIDFSRAMVALARRKAPRARIRRGSFLDAKLDTYDAVTATGEVFNYVFDPRNAKSGLRKLFRRVHAALRPGGLFVFDVAGPGRMSGRTHSFIEGEDWAVLIERGFDDMELTRHMTIFRKRGRHYRRSRESHTQKLHRPADVATDLRTAGFRVHHLKGYGEFTFPSGLAGFLARRR